MSKRPSEMLRGPHPHAMGVSTSPPNLPLMKTLVAGMPWTTIQPQPLGMGTVGTGMGDVEAEVVADAEDEAEAETDTEAEAETEAVTEAEAGVGCDAVAETETVAEVDAVEAVDVGSRPSSPRIHDVPIFNVTSPAPIAPAKRTMTR